MNINRRDRLSFLLRLWQADTLRPETWRASLEDPSTGERKGFANLETLIRFLKSLTMDSDFTGEQNEQPPRLSLDR